MAWLASALLVAAEALRVEGWHGTGNLLDVVRLALYWYWCRLAWQCSGNVENPVWTPLTKAALAAGLVANALV